MASIVTVAPARSIIASSAFTGAEGQQLERFVAVLEQPDELVEPLHCELVVECENKSLGRAASELPVGGDVENGELLFFQLLLQIRRHELPVDERRAVEQAPERAEFRYHARKRSKALDGL
jgi:hypothetical protein